MHQQNYFTSCDPTMTCQDVDLDIYSLQSVNLSDIYSDMCAGILSRNSGILFDTHTYIYIYIIVYIYIYMCVYICIHTHI